MRLKDSSVKSNAISYPVRSTHLECEQSYRVRYFWPRFLLWAALCFIVGENRLFNCFFELFSYTESVIILYYSRERGISWIQWYICGSASQYAFSFLRSAIPDYFSFFHFHAARCAQQFLATVSLGLPGKSLVF